MASPHFLILLLEKALKYYVPGKMNGI